MINKKLENSAKGFQKFFILVFLLIAAAVLSSPLYALAGSTANIIYITPEGGTAPSQDGTSWASAYSAKDIQIAIDKSAETGYPIWAAKGFYKLADTIKLKKGAKIYGGFSLGERKAERDIKAMMTNPLSSDHAAILLPASYDEEGNFRIIEGDANALSSDTVFDGFTVAGGDMSNQADDFDNLRGSGMYNNNSSPLVANCTFANNKAGKGGAVYNLNSSPTFSNCSFTNNQTKGVFPEDGGALFNSMSSPDITDCDFSGNMAVNGGALYNESSAPKITACTFRGNEATYDGGGVCWRSSQVEVNRCDFIGNSGTTGGAVSGSMGIQKVIECTFTNNRSSSRGGAIYCESIVQNISNCIFNGNIVTGNGFSEIFGGAIYADKSTQDIKNSAFTGNSARRSSKVRSFGSALYIKTSNQTITNCTFSNNTEADYGGAIYNLRSEKNIIVNSSFCSNDVTHYGAAIYNDRTAPVIVNSIFWNNKSGDAGVAQCITPPSSLTMQNCIADYNYGDKSNIVEDPKLIALDKNLQPTEVSSDIYIYRPTEESPAIANGLSEGLHTIASTEITVPSEDQTGNARKTAGSVDIGSCESSPKGEEESTGGGCNSGLPATLLILTVVTVSYVRRRRK